MVGDNITQSILARGKVPATCPTTRYARDAALTAETCADIPSSETYNPGWVGGTAKVDAHETHARGWPVKTERQPTAEQSYECTQLTRARDAYIRTPAPPLSLSLLDGATPHSLWTPSLVPRARRPPFFSETLKPDGMLHFLAQL